MQRSSSLSEAQREAALAWFAEGLGDVAVATRLKVSRSPVQRLYRRWQVRGEGTLVQQSAGRRYAFEVKLALVERFLAGETALALASEAGLSSPMTLQQWVREYRRDGPEGLRPKPRGPRPRPAPKSQALGDVAVPEDESELERLRRENELLRAKVAYLGKLKALREQARD